MKLGMIRSGLGLALMFCVTVTWADAPTREAELEARIAELERMVQQLVEAQERQQHLSRHQEAMRDQGGRHAEVEARLAKLEEEKADRPSGAGT